MKNIFSKSDNFGSGPHVCGANADWGRQIQPLSFEHTKEKPPYVQSKSIQHHQKPEKKFIASKHCFEKFILYGVADSYLWVMMKSHDDGDEDEDVDDDGDDEGDHAYN